MTNQEAIETIKIALAQVEWDYPMDYAVAFDMAIKALEDSRVAHIVRCKDCKHFMPQVQSCRHLYCSAKPEGFCSDGEQQETEKNS